jgi:ribosomal protein S18 acetylase RimI-like enzyme
MTLDEFVFDSQFAFLSESEALATVYETKVLVEAELRRFGDLRGYVRQEKWDSGKFGMTIGRLLWLENAVFSQAMLKDVVGKVGDFDCCYIRLNVDHGFCKYANSINWHPLSSKISQHLDLASYQPQYSQLLPYQEYSSQMANHESHIQQITALSEQSFSHGRFRRDRYFSRQQTDDMYRSWVTREVGNEASTLYFVTEESRVAAFLLYRKNISPLPGYTIGFVSLVATSPEYMGRRYASNLLNCVLQSAKQDGADYVIANTEQRNTDGLRFFAANGFVPTAMLQEYHVWSRGPATGARGASNAERAH